MGVPARIGIVTLGVSDVARAAAFYEAIGWEKTSSSMEEIAWFRTTGSFLGLFEFGALARDAGLSAEPVPTFRGVTLAINVETEEAVDAALRAAVDAGGSIIKQAQRAEWGGYSGYFADVDGYAWEVAHNPHFPIEDGVLHIP